MAALVVYCCCCCFNYLCYACINSYKPRFFFSDVGQFSIRRRPSYAVSCCSRWGCFVFYVCVFVLGLLSAVCGRFVCFFRLYILIYITFSIHLCFAAHSPGTKHRHHAVCSSHTLRFTQLIFAIPSELISRVLIPLRPSAGCVRGLAPRATVAPY